MPSELEYASQWREIAPSHHGARIAARGFALSGLSALLNVTRQMSSLLRRPRVQIVLLHHVFKDEENQFRNLLTRLKHDHTFIGYSEAIRRAEAGGDQIDRPYLSFSFDDGFKNCVRAAAILEEFGARACFFICPSIIGETNEQKIKAFCHDRLELPKPVEFMSWDDLKRLREAGHEIGGHTMTHANLARIPPAQAEDEIHGSFEIIKSRLGVVRHFAWTYGRFGDCTPQAVKCVYECGYESCASGERGCHGPQQVDRSLPLCVRRDHLVAAWPLRHSMSLLARSSRRLSPSNGEWPLAWRAIIARADRAS